MNAYRIFKRIAACLILVCCTAGCAGSPRPAEAPPSMAGYSGPVTLYCSMQEEEIQAIKEGFEAKYPQITMNYFFAGTNKVLTKLATEMQSGEISADLVWTGAPSDYRKLKENRYLSPYISPQAININEAFMDEHHYYIGGRLMSAVIAYNTDLVSEEDAPRTWDDLLDPNYKDVFVWANPTTAGGAYIATACQIFRLGEDAAWDYLKALDQNVHHYYKGAGDVISPVATGEFIASIAWAHDSFKIQQQGYPLKLIIPKQTAYEIGGSAIIKGGPNTENAKVFIDWLLTKEAQELSVATSYRYPVRTDVAAPVGLPTLEEVDLVDYDRDQAASMKEAVLEKFDAEIISNRA